MTTETTATTAEPSATVTLAKGSFALLLVLVASHFLVDIFACLVAPLWPDLESRVSWNGSILWLILLWTSTTSFFQLLFGYLSDRRPSPWLLWAAPLAAVVCLSSVGLVESPILLGLLLLIGGLGVAAFHPEAAATAGSLLPENRSRGMSLFAMGGYLGQAMSPTYSGVVTDRWGLSGLAWSMAWGLPAVAFVAFAMRSRRTSLAPPAPARSSAKAFQRRDLPTVLLLLGVSSLRAVPALGAPLAMAFLLDERGASNTFIGQLQSSFMAGIGTGGFVCALAMRRSFERRVLWLSPMLTCPLVCVIPWATDDYSWIPTATAGFLTGLSMPVLIGYGQRLLPHSQRVASSLTMGVSWGIASGVVVAAMAIGKATNSVQHVFWFFACSSLMSGLLVFVLDRTAGAESTGDSDVTGREPENAEFD